MDKKASVVLSFIILVVLVGILAGLYFFLESEDAKLGVMVAAVVVVIVGVVVIILQMTHGAASLRKKLSEIAPLVATEPAESLQEKYLQIYNLYMKISEKEKRNFYAQVVGVREKIEEQLRAEKKVEDLLGRSQQGSLVERKQNYELMHGFFVQLPQKVQEKYYPQVVHWKEELEKGR